MLPNGRKSPSGGGAWFFSLTLTITAVFRLVNAAGYTANNDWQETENICGLYQAPDAVEQNLSFSSNKVPDIFRITNDVEWQRERSAKVPFIVSRIAKAEEKARDPRQDPNKVNEWILSLEESEGEPKDPLPILEFQKDGIRSVETFALLNGTSIIPDLQNFSLCLWVSIHYSRIHSPIVSYAINEEKDNEILLTIRRKGIHLYLGDIVFYNNWNEDIAREMEWMHVCVTVSIFGPKLYIDSENVMFKEDHDYSKEKADSHIFVALQGGGSLVLGQDQDKLGGGFELKNSFSGAIADFQLFAVALDYQDVISLQQCQIANQKPLLDLQNPNWVLQNVRKEYRVIESLQDSQKGKFFLFITKEIWDISKRKCEDLGGILPSYETIPKLLMSLNYYFKYMGKEFRKVDIAYDSGNRISIQYYNSLRITWENGKYIKAHPINTSRKTAYVCHKKKRTYVRMYGLPKDSVCSVDSLYKIHSYKGSNILRGIDKSFIDYRDHEWCIRPTGDNSSKRLFCVHSESDLLPLGRKSWEHESSGVSYKILLTSCNKTQFTCDSGSCIPLSNRCNSYKECYDKSDEQNCKTFPKGFWGLIGPPLKPVSVNGSLLITDIPEVNLNKNFFSTTLWINFTWRDERSYLLNLRDEGETVVKFASYIWSPSLQLKPLPIDATTFLTTGNAKKLCEGEQQIYDVFEEYVYPTEMGVPSSCFELWNRTLLQVTWQCEFNLKKFPFEVIDCPIYIELEDGQLWNYINFTLPTFSNLPYMVSLESYSHTGSTANIRLRFHRQAGGYIVTTFIPVIILNIISINTFFFGEEDFTNRIMVTVSFLIVVASLSKQNANSLPNTSYTKCIDLVFLCTITFLSMIFVSHVICSFIWIRRKRINNVVFVRTVEELPKKTKLGSKRMNIFAMCVCLVGGFVCVIICIKSCF